MAALRIALFTRYPQAGRAKTRMIPALGPQGAADLHARLTERTIETIEASGLTYEVRYTGGERAAFEHWLGAECNLVEQGEGDLGDRMKRASANTPVILLGSDCPDLTADHLRDAARALETADVAIGPADDGGYWLLGLARPMDFLFDAVDWGSDSVWPETRSRLAERGIEPALLPTLSDCDRPEDLSRWPDLTR